MSWDFEMAAFQEPSQPKFCMYFLLHTTSASWCHWFD